MKAVHRIAIGATIATVGTAVMVLAACGKGGIGDTNSNHADLRGVIFHRPDKIEGYNNVDGQPNLVRLCIGGVAFATSSREYSSVLRVPEWDSSYCNAIPK